MSPFGGIGRGMKVGKEELCGVLAAVERYLKVDHAAEYRELEARVASIRAALKDVGGVRPIATFPSSRTKCLTSRSSGTNRRADCRRSRLSRSCWQAIRRSTCSGRAKESS